MGKSRLKVRVPKQIKIGVHSYKVIFSHYLKGVGEGDGAAQHEWQKILIAPELPPSQRAVTLLHEVLHIISKNYKCGLPEDTLDRLDEGLGEFLLNNLHIEFDRSDIISL